MLKILNFINNRKYRPYLLVSIGMHISLILLLIFNVSFVKTQKIKLSASEPRIEPETIKAVAVDQQIVEKEIARLEKLEKTKKIKEQQRKKKLEQELAKIKKQKQQEAQRLAQAKKKADLLKKEQEEIASNSKKIKQDLDKKQEERKKLEQELKEKHAQKQQEDLLEQLKREQEQILEKSLLAEEELLTKSKQRKAFIQKELERYIALQQSKVSRNWISRDSFLGRDLVTKLDIRLTDDGKVISVKIIKSSGDAALDISAKNAILKASPLPVPNDSDIRKKFTNYRFTFRPDELS